MMKYRVFVLLLAVLLLCGCEEVNVPDDTTVSLQVTDATVETIAPQETTSPTETTQATKPTVPPETQPATVPTEPPADTQLITVVEEAPPYNTEQSWLLVTPGTDNEYFKSTYVHLPGYAAIDDRRAYDGKYVFVNTEERPMMRGNHHEAYILYDAWMEKLENRHFRYAWEFFGCEAILEFDYAIRGDDLIITYYPHEGKYTGNGAWQSYGIVVDTSRGRNQLLIQFELFPDENSYLWYYATLDLDTGKLDYFLSQFDRSVFAGGGSFRKWLPNGDLLLTSYGETATILHVDIHRTQIRDLGTEFSGNLYDCAYDETGLIFAVETGYRASRDHDTSNPKLPHPYEYEFYRYSFEDGTVTKILEGGWYSFVQESPIVTYEDDEKNYHVHDLITGMDRVLPGAKGIMAYSDSFVIYRTEKDGDYLYDTVTGETVRLNLPKGYDSRSYYISPDGRKFMTNRKEENCYWLIIYDCDSKTFLEIQRSNPNPLRDELYFWVAEDKVLLYSNGDNITFRDIVALEIK